MARKASKPGCAFVANARQFIYPGRCCGQLCMPSDPVSSLLAMPKRPSRIDLLELDIDLRLADLWRETLDVGEWNLEVVAAFIRAAYGKGYCDALTEDAPGSLCHEHGYRIPDRKTEKRAA
jgi:hypothetical protein